MIKDNVMRHQIAEINDALFNESTIDGRFKTALDAVTRLGFSSLIYDYSPVPIAHDGALITPSVLHFRNVPESMAELWNKGGYYQIDPVQHAALEVAAPFVWSYDGRQSNVMNRVLKEMHDPVVRYLKDTRMTCGVTVPIHPADGGLATFTAIRIDPDKGFDLDAEQNLADIGLLGNLFHDSIFALFDQRERRCTHIRITDRERECLQLSADGLTAKEIAYKLGRSIATVTLHLNSATRKLGARNRFQAVARAAHYKLLEGHC